MTAVIPAPGEPLAETHPKIAAAVGYEPAAVREDLASAALVLEAQAQAERAAQLLADARLAWLAEAYVPSLQLYGVAKVAARTDPKVQELVGPLAKVFATRRERAIEPK